MDGLKAFTPYATDNIMENEQKRPKVGVAAIILKNGHVLMGQRINAHGHGTWSFPGGHLEFGEQLVDCAKREVDEEVGVKANNYRFATITNDILTKDDKHYITIFFVADWESGEPQVKEPDKMIKWQWVKWGEWPDPLFLGVDNLVKQKFDPFVARKNFVLG